MDRQMVVFFALAVAGVARCGGIGLPPLVGDGVADDTAAIQARLDSGVSCVYLPPPAKCYRISKSLRIGSDTELRLDRFTRVLLAPSSDCLMLVNRDAERGGDLNVAVTGGIWDFDNLRQGANPGWRHKCNPPQPRLVYAGWSPTNYLGAIMRFWNVSNVCVRGVTFRNPVTYCCQFAGATDVVVDDIRFDFTTWNPIRGNMDGIHFDGHCHRLRLTNLRGTCFDDMVALNADDGWCSPEGGEISDVTIDGVYADYCHSGVRILSAPHPCRRITIRNVHGRFYTYAVGFTHYFPKRLRGTIEDVVIENVFAEKSLSPEELGVYSRKDYPLIWFEGPLDVGNVTIRNYVRDEKTLPIASILVDKPAAVRHLTVRDGRMVNGLKENIPFIENRGKIGKLTVENIEYIPSEAVWSNR